MRSVSRWRTAPVARLKDWRGISMRYTPYDDLLLSAIALAAAVVFWLRQ